MTEDVYRSLRRCIDANHLNRQIKQPHKKLPTLEQILPGLKNAKIFSALDARNCFWQLELERDSRKLTTFATPFGDSGGIEGVHICR